MNKEELEARIQADPMFKMAYQHELAKAVLKVIATCSDGSTVSAIRDIAQKCLDDLN